MAVYQLLKVSEILLFDVLVDMLDTHRAFRSSTLTMSHVFEGEREKNAHVITQCCYEILDIHVEMR